MEMLIAYLNMQPWINGHIFVSKNLSLNLRQEFISSISTELSQQLIAFIRRFYICAKAEKTKCAAKDVALCHQS